MEFYEQYASYPFEEYWLSTSQRRTLISHNNPNYETLLPTDHQMMNYELLSHNSAAAFSSHSVNGNVLEETLFSDHYFPDSSWLLNQEVGLVDGYCSTRDGQFHGQQFLADGLMNSSNNFNVHEDNSNYGISASSLVEEDVFGDEHFEANMEILGACKMEPIHSPDQTGPGLIGGLRSRAKRLEGQPSKNLMAERRRRKRLNDRLSMLRSIVPKISKMDRTSILGDTIDYMKELLEKIHNLQDQIKLAPNHFNSSNNLLKDVKPNDMIVRNSPKFNVERRKEDTKVEICCSAKPGLLLSTVNTLEALGLEIQHCVISCFNDFALHASCSEEMGQKTMVSPDDIKQALFRKAGYGGRCL